ncbi:gamma-glutamylcyclotransferase family protein [Comamonas kerstersii]|uniref:gamma-glutamylcyclotransferase family protein n=1 Tax=Comamonas kerstersii TaxID=225992 RepID=UPI001B339D1A|nr:gamma-glutamylcyclotransferase family protein [Comamonas kerstersii]QTW19820.1 gamma-glutamylcyclotransferase [Comamonas kerstersii]
MSIPSALASKMAAAWQPCGASYVAVYGTLRAGATNDIASLRPGIAMAGHTILQGTLYDFGWYPGLQLQGQQPVLAEVYPLDPVLERVLDAYEGVWPMDTGEYIKRLVTTDVQLLAGGVQRLQVLVYEAQAEGAAHRPTIDASDWLSWNRARQPEGAG